MSKNTKIVIGIIIIVIIAGGIWWWYASKQNGTGGAPSSASQSNAEQNDGTAAPVLSQSTSDASLNQDLSAIDGQLNGLASDSASADQSLSAQSGGQ
jgi:cytoskeletal protein RodZ